MSSPAIAIPTLTPDDDRPALELDRSPQLGRQALGGRNGVVDAVDAIEQHRELVAALSRRDVAGPDRADESVGDFDQQPVAGAVTQRVVDDLEVVEVEEQEGDLRPASRRRLASARSTWSLNRTRFASPVSGSWSAS